MILYIYIYLTTNGLITKYCSLSFFVFFYKPMDQKHVTSDQDQSSMLKVICSQRDRFRARLRETEEVE